MNLPEVFFLGVGLSMDALAVSIALGTMEQKNFTWKKVLLSAAFFGFFQFLMPLAGFFGGCLFDGLVQSLGRFAASLLLFCIGGKMIHDRNKEEHPRFAIWPLVVLAVATSIDALLVGIGFACLGRQNILPDVVLIGCITFLISAAGGFAGRKFGDFCGNRCEIIGGVVLILIGLKVLVFG